MKKSDVFSSKFLSAADLNGKPFTLVIASATLETLTNPSGEQQRKIVLRFRGASKAMVLNATNFDSIADIAGDDTDNWTGARVEVFPTTTELRGKTVDCVRVRKPAGELALQAPAKSQPVSTQTLADDLDDVIPF